MMKYQKILLFVCLVFSSQIGFSQIAKNTKMNLKNLHQETTGVQTNMMFPATDGKVISLQIQKGSQLKEHITKVPALLVCVSGKAIYEDETGIKETLQSGDFIKIVPNVKHWVNGLKNSNLLLIK